MRAPDRRMLLRSFLSRLSIVALALVVGCDSDEPVCEPVADSCTSECAQIVASPIDGVRQCKLAARTVGCRQRDGVFNRSSVMCVVRVRDDAVFEGLDMESFQDATHWRACTKGQRAMMGVGNFCR
jgi:hypothetical protein